MDDVAIIPSCATYKHTVTQPVESSLSEHLPSPPYLSLQLEFAQVCAQEKAKKAASNMTGHTDLETDDGKNPTPTPLKSPSHTVVKWTTAMPIALRSSSSHKVCKK